MYLSKTHQMATNLVGSKEGGGGGGGGALICLFVQFLKIPNCAGQKNRLSQAVIIAEKENKCQGFRQALALLTKVHVT